MVLTVLAFSMVLSLLWAAIARLGGGDVYAEQVPRDGRALQKNIFFLTSERPYITFTGYMLGKINMLIIYPRGKTICRIQYWKKKKHLTA
jgi:hypothetical protein